MKFLVSIFLAILLSFYATYVGMLGWNWFVSPILDLPLITFWQMFVLGYMINLYAISISFSASDLLADKSLDSTEKLVFPFVRQGLSVIRWAIAHVVFKIIHGMGIVV